ncbi:MAG: response regulator [Candidatus Desulfaltia sp.]|nr:response regulator [Candidatus Desulfaltia sp.]
MAEIKYDIKRGADVYRLIYHARLRSWILKGVIKRGEAIVWRSGLSGWRKPEDLEELKPYFRQKDKEDLKRKKQEIKPGPFPKKRIKNILIIEDEEDLCWLLSNTLKDKGYNVIIANTISEGAACLKESLDLVFLDLKLPDGDGMDILPKIKEITSETLVAIISAYGSEERMEEARAKGVYSFINKPFTEERILDLLSQISGQAIED